MGWTVETVSSVDAEVEALPVKLVLHVFAKKSRRTPRRALATARERLKQVTP